MPFEGIDNRNDEWACAIWHIEEPIDYFLSCNDFETHCQGYKLITHPSKQLQWLASRWLSKEILKQKWNLPFKGIVNNPQGKPSLLSYDFHLSLSNSHHKATAIVHQKNVVGIDIEMIKPKVKSIASKFLKPIEIKHLGENIEHLTLAWCCKESVYKIYGKKEISLKNHIGLPPFLPNEFPYVKASLEINQAAQTYCFKHIIIDNYMLAYSAYPE
jgi:phosphopantetheinyl transferase